MCVWEGIEIEVLTSPPSLLRQILHVIDKSKMVVRKLYPQIFGEDAKIPEQLVVTRLKLEYICFNFILTPAKKTFKNNVCLDKKVVLGLLSICCGLV